MLRACTLRLVGAWLLAAGVGLTGCVLPEEHGDETRWQPQLLYLNRAPYSRLYIEVAAVAGTEPSDAALEQLRAFLATYCDKPGGIRIVRDVPIPRAEAARGFSYDALASRYLLGPPAEATNPPPAFIYILYYDSSLGEDATSTPSGGVHRHQSPHSDFHWVNTFPPHSQRVPFLGAIFIDRRYLARWPRSFEGPILMHEAGHLLGLVQQDKHEFHDHCTNQRCLMRTRLMLDSPFTLFGGEKTGQTNLCKMCQAELAKSRTESTPANLVFLGPVLVRSEAGYSVATLPGQLTLFSGELAKFDPAGFLRQSQEAAGHPAAWREPEGSTHAWWFLHESGDDWARQVAGVEGAETDRLEVVRKAATNAVPTMQYLLGRAYLAGEGLPKDEAEGARWVRRSADSGYAPAQDTVGMCFAAGKGLPRDVSEAFHWYRKAADQGLASAQNHLGSCYELGDGVPVSLRRAFRWYRKAAQAGDTDGQRHLGLAYAQGLGTHADLVKAYAWLSAAAEQGDEAATAELGGLTRKLSDRQLHEGQRRAAALLRHSATKPALDP